MKRTLSAVVTLILPRVVRATVTDDTLTVDMEDGRTVSVPIGWFPRLAHGNPAERSNVQISGAGYGLHWPDLCNPLAPFATVRPQDRFADAANTPVRHLPRTAGAGDGRAGVRPKSLPHSKRYTS
jgi:Protein of unknown function (DUF2442)